MTGRKLDSDSSTEMLSSKESHGILAPDGLNLVVQGKRLNYNGPADVRSLLESQGENSAYANVRINGEVLRNRDFENMNLKDGDNVDFLYYMGGGFV